MISLDRLGAESLALWKSAIDLGDHVGVEGEVITSRSGELSVLADSWALTAKCLRPLPDKHHGLTDPESRVRQRYVDLIVNADARDMVRIKAAVLAFGARRRSPATATSRSRRRRCNCCTAALPPGRSRRTSTRSTSRMYLRIAIELYLKRVVVGGIERVYEIGRIFRNEGVDSTHSPEFTMLEAYEAYGDYNTMAVLTRDIVLDAARAVGIAPWCPTVAAASIDLAAPWRTMTIHQAVSQAVDTEVTIDTDVEDLRAIAARYDVALPPGSTGHDHGVVILELFEKLVEHTLIEPTFIRDYPVSVRPLARPHRDDPRLVEAWDLVMNGVELAPGILGIGRPDRAAPQIDRTVAIGSGW